ncbi:energy-coupling factor transporter transmembrane component T family protein [Desulfogranum japonicum]|uniref:energy-coupling factor transporter transmembrane component T family protein n=1 Tax=Desulfogranum japonicum TaxID=231447 RepID=UPI0004139E39|nr:energy-coupling factor transporter transmembrane component T [Desulfogranum japonicum]
MAQLTSFSYRHGASLLHQLDTRFKLLFMVLLSLAAIDTSFLWLSFVTLSVILLLRDAGVNLRQTAKELRFFSFFLLFVLASRSLTTDGTTLFSWWIFAPTMQGLEEGVRFCWRILLVILLSLGFIVSSRTGEIKASIEFYLAKVPFIPEKKVSTMLSLLLRFIPLIFTRIQQTIDAQKARCIEARKNPYYRLVKLTLPTMRRIFRDGELLAVAMTSRCYNDNRTGLTLQSSTLDYIAWLVVGTVVILRWFI